jgi:hypothetical protein
MIERDLLVEPFLKISKINNQVLYGLRISVKFTRIIDLIMNIIQTIENIIRYKFIQLIFDLFLIF